MKRNQEREEAARETLVWYARERAKFSATRWRASEKAMSIVKAEEEAIDKLFAIFRPTRKGDT